MFLFLGHEPADSRLSAGQQTAEANRQLIEAEEARTPAAHRQD